MKTSVKSKNKIFNAHKFFPRQMPAKIPTQKTDGRLVLVNRTKFACQYAPDREFTLFQSFAPVWWALKQNYKLTFSLLPKGDLHRLLIPIHSNEDDFNDWSR